MKPGRALLLLAQFIASVLLAGWAFPRLAPGDAGPAFERIGRPGARNRMVYAHGFDTYGPNWIEIRNREALRALARRMDLCIAVPRAPGRAWPYSDAAKAARSRRWLLQAARGYFPDGARFGILGFSNAGYMVAHLYPDGLPPGTNWVVAVGAAGEPGGRAEGRASARIPLRLLVGTHDPAHSDALLLARLMKARGWDAVFADYPGVHQLPFTELQEVLAPLLTEPTP